MAIACLITAVMMAVFGRSARSRLRPLSAVLPAKGLRHLPHGRAVELNSDNTSAFWGPIVNYDDKVKHTLSLKLAVLGGNAVDGEDNIVTLYSFGVEEMIKLGTIAELTHRLPMTELDVTIDGLLGCTFILDGGRGHVIISGNHMVGYPSEDEMDDTQMDEEGNIENELHKTNDESEEEIKDKKSAKRKATPKAIKHKKAKMDVQDDQSGEGEEDDDDDEDEDYDFEKEVKNKKFKKAKVVGKKNEKAAKTKPEKDSGKKSGKNVKK